MSYYLHGATLALFWFLAVNVVLSLAVVRLAPRAFAPRTSALALWMRLLPSTAAWLFAVVLFLPSYWKFEPRESVEGFDIHMTAGALADDFAVSKPTMSGHFAKLKAAGLIQGDNRGGTITYSLNLSVVEEVVLGFMGRLRIGDDGAGRERIEEASCPTGN